MEKLTQALVDKVANFMTGKKREKFLTSVNLINESLAAGKWLPGASRKADTGFYQGLVKHQFDSDYSAKNRKQQEDAWKLGHTLSFGGGFDGDLDSAIELFYSFHQKNAGLHRKGYGGVIKPLKVTEEIVRAWVELCNEKADAKTILYFNRPKPQITKVGLSPKVTKTLKEMELDLDLSTIKSAIKFRKVQARDEKTGKLLFDRKGEPLMVTESYVEFSKGALHGATRFQNPGCCEACGKPIPSRMFAPVEVKDNKSGKQVALWLGTDCAKNIFGVKDIGVKK